MWKSVNGNIVTKPYAVLQAWKEHFGSLGCTRKHTEKVIEVADDRATTLLPMSDNNAEDVLDIPSSFRRLNMH